MNKKKTHLNTEKNERNVHQQLRTFDSLISPDMCSICKQKMGQKH